MAVVKKVIAPVWEDGIPYPFFGDFTGLGCFTIRLIIFPISEVITAEAI
jgi:hypothetical protein